MRPIATTSAESNNLTRSRLGIGTANAGAVASAMSTTGTTNTRLATIGSIKRPVPAGLRKIPMRRGGVVPPVDAWPVPLASPERSDRPAGRALHHVKTGWTHDRHSTGRAQRAERCSRCPAAGLHKGGARLQEKRRPPDEAWRLETHTFTCSWPRDFCCDTRVPRGRCSSL